MKKFKIQRVSGFILSVMLLITLIILGLFFFGGETPMDQRVVADPSLSEPLYTDAILYWNYILFVLASKIGQKPHKDFLATCFRKNSFLNLHQHLHKT